MYEIKITTNKKVLSLNGLIGSVCFDSIMIENSGDNINITDFSWAFYGCSRLKTVNLNNFDISEVTSFRYIFWRDINLFSVEFGNYKTINLKDISNMFMDCHNLLSINL